MPVWRIEDDETRADYYVAAASFDTAVFAWRKALAQQMRVEPDVLEPRDVEYVCCDEQFIVAEDDDGLLGPEDSPSREFAPSP